MKHQHVCGSKASLAAAMALALIAGCGGGSDSSGGSTTTSQPQAIGSPPPPALSDQIAARTHYFGAENVNAKTGEIRKDLLILSWMTNTTFAAAINGKVALMDAALMRREQAPGRTPTTLNEVVNLMPSYILVGKAAQGYVDLAANVAFRTGATVVGTGEACEAIEADARRQQQWTGSQSLLKCNAIVPKNQAIGQQTNVMALSDLGVCLRAVKHGDLFVTTDATFKAAGFNWGDGTDPRDPVLWPVGTAATDGIGTTAAVNNLSVVYHMTLGGGRNFGFVWNDRVSSLKEQMAAVTPLLQALPKTDLQVGSVDVPNAATLALRDPALYIQAIQPKIFFPAGHDAASQRAGAFNTAELMKRALERSITGIGLTAAQTPEVRVNFDPTDYIKPHFMTFDPAAAPWQRTGDRSSTASCQ